MDFVNFVMALSPILVVLVGILGFKQSAKRVSPIALVWTLILAFTYFNVTGASFADNVKTLDPLVWKGIKEGLKIVLMVFGAFTILNLLRETGAIDDVKSTIARISDDRRVQVIVIGMMMPIFLEGAAGAGAPAAIAAPFLVALGFDPVTSIAVALLGDATPASWGGAGLTTINGGAALVDAGLSTVSLNAAMVGRFHMFGVLIIPFIMVGMVFGKKGFKGAVPYLCFAGVSTCAVMGWVSRRNSHSSTNSDASAPSSTPQKMPGRPRIQKKSKKFIPAKPPSRMLVVSPTSVAAPCKLDDTAMAMSTGTDEPCSTLWLTLPMYSFMPESPRLPMTTRS